MAMELLLAWGAYITLGVIGLALLWALLAPRIARRVRLAILGLFAALALLAMGVAAQIPQDYRPGNLVQYGQGSVAIVIQLLVAVVGGAAALAAVGRRRSLDATLLAAGAYLAGTGLVLYAILDGSPAIVATALVFVGTAVLVASSCALAGLPRWSLAALGLAVALV